MQNLAHHSASGGDRLRLAGQRLGKVVAKVPPARWKQAAMLLITLWLAYSLAQLFWLLMPEPDVAPARLSATAVSADSGSSAQRPVDIDALKGLYLFGASAPGSSTEQAAPVVQTAPRIEDDAVDTSLNLVLRGVVASNQEDSARAIIADARNQAIYSPGDDIEGLQGVKLAKVLNQRVILDNRGQYESLWLYKDDPNAPRTRVSYNEADMPPSRSWEGDENSEAVNESADN
ncbi:MAG TPA: type II secretion system protein N, partial [Cellvibrionaceae bacterium]